MKNVIEVIKTNKGTILKRGLIVLGAVAGLAIAGKVLIAKGVDEDETDIESEDEDTEDTSDSNEE